MASAPQAMAVAKALEAVLRADRGRIMATLSWRLGSLQLARLGIGSTWLAEICGRSEMQVG